MKKSPTVGEPNVPLPEGSEVELLGDDLALLSFPVPEACMPEALTTAEQEVALMVYAGARNEDIGRERGVALKTVSNQLEAIYRKLGVCSRVELVLRLRGSTKSVR